MAAHTSLLTDPVGPAPPVWDLLVNGGSILVLIAACALAVVILAIQRQYQLQLQRVIPGAVDEVLALVARQEFDAALELAQTMDAPAGRILASGLHRRHLDLAHIERAMTSQGYREFQILRCKLRPLVLIAHLVPLFGLFGTVLGLYWSLHGGGAGGLDAALLTTLAGLAVAIPTWLLVAHFRNRVHRLVLAADEKLGNAAELLTEPLLLVVEE